MSRFENAPMRRPESTKWPLIATAGIMAAGALNHYASEQVYGRNRGTQLITLPYNGPQVLAAGIAFPGMGNIGNGGEKMAQLMSVAVPIQQPWSHMSYDNLHELTIESMAKCVSDRKKELGFRYTDGFFSSIGFPIGMAVLLEAKTPLRVIVIDSSPLKPEHGYGKKVGDIAENIPNLGIAGKFAGVLIADAIRPGKTKGSRIVRAAQEAIKGGSQKLFQEQYKLLKQIAMEANKNLYADIINKKHTRVIYVSPPAGKDNTVRVGEAYIDIKNFFAYFGVEVERVVVPDGNHAETEKTITYGLASINKAYTDTHHLLVAA